MSSTKVETMAQSFEGAALPLNSNGVQTTLGQLKVQAADLWAVLSVETRACGFFDDKRPAILFERHVFHRLTDGAFDQRNPDVSAPTAGGYGATGAHQYDRLTNAMQLSPSAALQSASWGIGQVMGFNFSSAGFHSVEDMVAAMQRSEADQLQSMASFMVANHLDAPLRNHDWKTFARMYNGPDYAKNNYDTRLAASNQKYLQGGTPDLALRAAQVYLTYLDLNPGSIDGVMGRFTRSALNAFQQAHKMAVTDTVDDATLDALNSACSPK